MIPAGRASKIRDLLERWPELTETSETGSIAGGGGSGVSLTPHENRCALNAKADPAWHPGMSTSPAHCTCAYRGVAELGRLLRVMRDDRAASLVLVSPGRKQSVRSLYWHVNHRYVLATTKIGPVPVVQLDKHGRVKHDRQGRQVVEMVRSAVTVWDSRVDPLLVTAGIGYLAERWSLEVEPTVPRELLVAA